MSDESIVRNFPGLEQQTGTLRLSEAIRIGARLRPQQCTIVLSQGDAVCALGAAAIGRGWNGRESWLVRTKFLPDVSDRLWSQIGARNDRGESRESIADWLEAQGL